jgi:Protein of unknown function (DUF1569)
MDYAEFLYEQFPDLLDKLDADASPLWGKMNPQQMIEHLILIVGYSNGRFNFDQKTDPERLAYRKMRYFEKYVPMTHDIKQPFLPETPHPVMYPDLETAKNFLLQQLERFDDYYAEHPRIEAMHPVLGMLNYNEWVEMHARHFEHHLRQFGVLSMPMEG